MTLDVSQSAIPPATNVLTDDTSPAPRGLPTASRARRGRSAALSARDAEPGAWGDAAVRLIRRTRVERGLGAVVVDAAALAIVAALLQPAPLVVAS